MGVVERSMGMALVLVAGLGGCAPSPYEPASYRDTRLDAAQAADMAGVTRRHTTPSGRPLISDDEKCRDYGFLPGTIDYANCRSMLQQERAKARATAPERPPER